MVRRILFAFCRGIGASARLGDQPGTADGTRMEPLPRISPTYTKCLSAFFTRNERVGANVVPFLSKP